MVSTEKTEKSSVGVDPVGSGEEDREDALDPRAIESYRRVLDYAAAVLDGSISPQQALSAGEALFGALSRHDAEWLSMREVVRVVASAQARPGMGICMHCGAARLQKINPRTYSWQIADDFEHTLDCPVTKAREIMARLQSHTEVH